jgi:ABC-type multidrug transport system permease subunit
MALTKILVAVGLYENHVVGGLAFVTIFGAVVGLAVSIVVAWKLGGVLRKLAALVGSRLPEPFLSCIEFGVAGSVLLGGLMLATILLLGHARPAGWDFQNVLPLMVLGFGLFLVAGLTVGLWRRRQE